MVVFLPVVAHHDLGFCQVPQLFPVQTLIPETTMKAFLKPVLPRAARLDIEGLDLVLLEPALHPFAMNSEPLSLRKYSRAHVVPRPFAEVLAISQKPLCYWLVVVAGGGIAQPFNSKAPRNQQPVASLMS
jgi:hypothetical protein